MKTITISKLDDLHIAAREIIAELGTRNVILFRAEMGAGKTTLISELMRQLGSVDRVTSPTFAIINEYLTGEKRQVYHFDMYRITSTSEATDVGWEEFFDSDALCLVEWPENIEEILPKDAMTVEITGGRTEERTFNIY